MIDIDVNEGDIVQARNVERRVPEFTNPYPETEYQRRLKGKIFLILIAITKNETVGFKVGYDIGNGTFYSWVGGVIPDFRKMGVADRLLNYQEKWVLGKGFTKIRVKSMNRYTGMMIFLLRRGYTIIGYEGQCGDPAGKVLFEKNLKINETEVT